MPNVSYFIDKAGSEGSDYKRLAHDFMARFVASARANDTFRHYHDADRPGINFVSGVDEHGRNLVANWSAHPAYVIDGVRVVMVRDTAQDGAWQH